MDFFHNPPPPPNSMLLKHHVLSPQLVSLLLVGVAAWGKWFGLVSSIQVVAGVICVGIFLLLVAFVGLCGALRHHQVLLFFVSFRQNYSPLDLSTSTEVIADRCHKMAAKDNLSIRLGDALFKIKLQQSYR